MNQDKLAAAFKAGALWQCGRSGVNLPDGITLEASAKDYARKNAVAQPVPRRPFSPSSPHDTQADIARRTLPARKPTGFQGGSGST
jgi:hypothetical protein